MKKPLVLFFFLFTVCRLSAQTGSWNIVNVKGTFTDKWSVFAEGQLRSWKVYDQFYYYELKTAATYNFTKELSVTGGLGTYHTYTTGGNFKKPITNNEFRTWLQLMMVQNFGRIKIDHRYRMEQRWVTAGYRNRYRYRLNAIVALNHKKLMDKTIYATAFDEVFFTNKNPYFERNRVFGGLGYQVNNHVTFQAGYINQFDYSLTKEFAKGYLQLTAFLAFNFKKGKVYVPAGHQAID
jgi:hypothetical protein